MLRACCGHAASQPGYLPMPGAGVSIFLQNGTVRHAVKLSSHVMFAGFQSWRRYLRPLPFPHDNPARPLFSPPDLAPPRRRDTIFCAASVGPGNTLASPHWHTNPQDIRDDLILASRQPWRLLFINNPGYARCWYMCYCEWTHLLTTQYAGAPERDSRPLPPACETRRLSECCPLCP